MTTTDLRFADVADLGNAQEGSYYFIAGTGGDLAEWVSGYEELLAERGIGRPTAWFRTNGATVNGYAAQRKGGLITDDDQFKGDLTCLLFPLDGLDVGRLAIFKLEMGDRWFDDVIDNMRTA